MVEEEEEEKYMCNTKLRQERGRGGAERLKETNG